MSGRTRVYVDMVGDLFHAGHVELLRQARTFGDRLMVGVFGHAPDVVTMTSVREHDIAVLVHGDDISDEAIEAVYGEVAAAGMLRLVSSRPGISTTDLLRRIRDRGA